MRQNRLRWYGHVLMTDENDCVKNSMDDEVGGVRSKGRPKKTWTEVIQQDCQTHIIKQGKCYGP